MLIKINHSDYSLASIAKWFALILIVAFSLSSHAQDNKPVNNKGTIKQTRAKSVKMKEKGSTKDIAGKRLRTKNANSVAGRAVYSNPSPYANERKGKDRVAKSINGQPARIRSRSAESARNNVYPQRGPFVNRGSTKSETGRSKRSQSTRSGKLSTRRTSSFGGSVNPPGSRSGSGETSRANAYPQKGPFVNQSSRQTERSGSKSQVARRGRLSTNARTARGVRMSSLRSNSSSAESSKGKRFQQGGVFFNRPSKSTETVSSGTNRYSRRKKLSAGPNPPGKKRILTPRSASQQFVTRGRKDVYWGKFSKGEKAITTDISGNPLRRRNYRTPPNEAVKPKDPYAGRKKSSRDRAYSGTFSSGHVSGSKRAEKAWLGDVSGQPIRKRASKQNEVVGRKKVGKAVGSISASGKYRSNQPFKTSVGSLSASGRYRSNKPLSSRAGSTMSASGKNRDNSFRPRGGGSVSATGKYRTNRSFNNGGGGSVSASARYRSNKPLDKRSGSSLSVSNQNRSYNDAPKGGGSISGSGKYRSNKPFTGGGGSVSASARYRSNKPLNKRSGSSLSVSNQNRIYDYAPKGGGSVSASARYRSNKPLNSRSGSSLSISNQNRVYDYAPKGGGSISATGKYRSSQLPKNRIGSLSASGENRTYAFKPKGGGSMSGKVWNNDNKPIEGRSLKIGASAQATFQGKAKVREPEKGGGSVSGKLWNNKGQPIEVRIPTGAQAADVGYSGKTRLPFFKRAYVRNPNAVEKALKKESPYTTVYMADGLQVSMKARQTGTKPKAVKGSMPGLAPTKATVKASEYSRSMKMYWSYKHNPSSAKESQKTIAPSKAHGRLADYQGNIKMAKFNNKIFLPDSRFAHGTQNNVKEERTMITDFKLLWSKIFKKNGIQPTAVKEKPVRPRYDKRERELWPGLYD